MNCWCCAYIIMETMLTNADDVMAKGIFERLFLSFQFVRIIKGFLRKVIFYKTQFFRQQFDGLLKFAVLFYNNQIIRQTSYDSN